METEKNKIGELFKNAFQDYKPEPSSGLWDQIARRPEMTRVTPPAQSSSWWKWMIGGASITAVTIAVIFIFRTSDKPANPLTLTKPQAVTVETKTPEENHMTIDAPQSSGIKVNTEVKTTKPTVDKGISNNKINPLTTIATKHTVLPVMNQKQLELEISDQVKENPITVVPPPGLQHSVTSKNDPSRIGVENQEFTMNNPMPAEGIEVIPDQKICFGESVDLWAKGGTTYVWSTGETSETISVSPQGTSIYYLTVTDHSGQPNEFQINVTVNTCKTIYAPTAFSPNNDGKNDIYKVYGTEFSNFTLRIISRTGQIIFETHDINEGWDGRIKGNMAEVGVYVYQLLYTDALGKEHKETGQFTLIK